eukprot:g6758.t1
MLPLTIGLGSSSNLLTTRPVLRTSSMSSRRGLEKDRSSLASRITIRRLRRTVRRRSSSPSSSHREDVPKRIAILVEPSPFTYVSGYKNRFCNTIKHLVEAGCEVLVVTTGRGVTFFGADSSAMRDAPATYHGAEVMGSYSFGCPFYPNLPLTLGLSPRIYKKLAGFKPDIIHCSTPGLLCFSAWIYAKLLNIPLALSYHTHLPKYAPKYKLAFLAPLLWALIRLLHSAAHLTLLTSTLMLNEFHQEKAAPKESMLVWKKGVDTDQFHPKFKSNSMRHRLTSGHPGDPVMVYVGRLGPEKNLEFLKGILTKLPNLHLAFVGDGPAREELHEYFSGTKTTFLGMLHGVELSSAYASADVFVMPSETETLGFVVMEAMASQIPVVAVNAGGIPDIICSKNKGGFLYQAEDVDQATKLVDDLIENEHFRKEMGLAARKQVDRWNWKAATKHLLEVQYPLAISRFRKEQQEMKGDNLEEPIPSPN